MTRNRSEPASTGARSPTTFAPLCRYCYLKSSFWYLDKPRAFKNVDRMLREASAWIAKDDLESYILNTGNLSDSLTFEAGRPMMAALIEVFRREAEAKGRKHALLIVTKGGAEECQPLFETPACRNVVASSIALTAYAFLDGPRSYSPVVSSLRMSPKPGLSVEWRTDFDPLHDRIVANSFAGMYFFKSYAVSIGQDSLHYDPVLEAAANQVNAGFHWGNENRRGLNAGVTAVYDLHQSTLRDVMSQFTYNTDCCGLSVQYGKWNVGVRFDTVFRLSLSVANIGSFGTLRKQEQMF